MTGPDPSNMRMQGPAADHRDRAAETQPGVEPRVSVLLPVYNAERYLAEAVESVLAQTFTDFELLALDDGSTDRSAEILAAYAAHDRRVHVLTAPHAKLIRTLNRGIAAARGEYVARMDSDDVCLPERFARQVAFLDAHPDCVAVGTALRMIDEEGDPFCDEFPPQDHVTLAARLLRGQGGICHPSTMIRREPLVASGGYRIECFGVEDQDLWLRLMDVGSLTNLSHVGLKYRVHPANVSFLHHAEARERFRWMLEDTYRRRGLPMPDDLLGEVPPPTSGWDRRRMWAWSAVQAGNLRTARKHAWRVWRERPWSRQSWSLAAYALLGNAAERLRRIVRRDSNGRHDTNVRRDANNG